ncbi:chromosome segregation ATPase [Photobacterium atrarenae]|uniref:Chromosome segregation ATPase n=1 Tax=Photobacterium atrarenae TaxID=865757 RepID=A0ABY5GM54_9GAMM|nr:chromosome segregation ATPase [Photobacterium atrarenae]UTV30226.1 chromosome segregation ATPase [Photobacterium atrarenae]
MTSSWKASLLAGFILGGVLASAVWYRSPGPTQEEYETLQQKNADWAAKHQQLEERFETYEAEKALEIEQLNEQLTQAKADFEKQKAAYEKQFSSLKQQQKKLAVSKKQLDTQVVALKSTAEKQQTVLSDSKALYQQQLLLQKQVAQAEADVKKAKRVANEFKQACDEFKSGSGWNWVSQADCDKFNAKLRAVAEKEAQLTALQKELDALNQKIEVSLPKK